MISYFDAHCDTIWRCMETGPVADYGETEQEQRAFSRPAAACGRTAATWTCCGTGALPDVASSSPCTTT
ncbi:MAG: hypothetical protein ACLS3F_00930 [Oscillospiraceae bacterium]